jgi:endonuclease/exonuclease/phosphatase family metal-dependent hydrolase
MGGQPPAVTRNTRVAERIQQRLSAKLRAGIETVIRALSRPILTAALLCLAGCFHCPVGVVATPAPPLPAPLVGGPTRLKILTWNIWMMPGFTFQSPQNRRRAAAIADELLKQDFDIICFEKAFDSHARDVLLKAMGKEYKAYGPANDTPSLKINSGVWIFSRVPLTKLGETQFRDCAGFECASRKGAILLDGIFQGRKFQLVATHLQGESGDQYTASHQLIRDKQMTQIRDDLLARHPEPGVPLIIAGDFDTPRFEPGTQPTAGVTQPESDGYRFMIRTFGDPESRSVGVTFDDNCSDNDLAMSGKGRRDELDYILVRPDGVNLAPAWTRMIFRHPDWDGHNRQDLSYRYGVAASIEFR